MVYNLNGEPLIAEKPFIMVGAVLDASSEENRFAAMKQLFDIGKKRIKDPNIEIQDSEFTYATKGAVCLLPDGNTAMYEKYPFSMLYAKNASMQAIPASVTKVMSLITGLDYVDCVKDVIAIKSSDVTAGSGSYFSAGDTMTIEELMLAMMLPSSNTAATAFGRICGEKMLKKQADGTYTDTQCKEAFVSAMNVKAAYIGMSNSVFATPSGTGNSNQTTAKDLVQMVMEACSYPQILKVWNKKSYTISIGGTDPREQALVTTVTNQSLEADYFILGGKTGSVGSAEALVMVAIPK